MARLTLVFIAALFTLPTAAFAADDPAGSLPDARQPQSAADAALRNPKVQDLGNGRFRVGLIEVDRNQRRFTVPAVVHQSDGTQEFILATKGGYKGYETTLEAGATAYEFNVACLLIGLDPKNAGAPRYHFDPNKIKGDPVAVSISWPDGKKTRRLDANQIVIDSRSGKPLADTGWVYTGSTFTPDGSFLAQMDGVLIGFVHDPAAIITTGIGADQATYGSIVPNAKALPPKESRVTVEVKAISKTTAEVK